MDEFIYTRALLEYIESRWDGTDAPILGLARAAKAEIEANERTHKHNAKH